MTTTNPLSAPVATPVLTEPSAVPESGGMWNEITTCGANVLHLAYRVAGIVMIALQKVLESILSLASSSFDKVHTWITGAPSTGVSSTGVPSTASPASAEEERVALEAAIRAADTEERLLGTAPRTSPHSALTSLPTATTMGQLSSVQQLSNAAGTDLSEDDQYAIMQMDAMPNSSAATRRTDDEDVRAPIPGRTECLIPMEETDERYWHEQQARDAEQRSLLEELALSLATVVLPSPTQQTERHEAPIISGTPARLQIPAEIAPLIIPDGIVPLIPGHRDGVVFLQQRCPNLLNYSVENISTVLRPAGEAVVQFLLDPRRPFSEQLPSFVLEPSTSLPNAPTFKGLLEDLRKKWIAEITGINSNAPMCVEASNFRPLSTALAGRASQIIDRLIAKPAFLACVYGACIA